MTFALYKPLRPRIYAMLWNKYNKFVWNGVIRCIYVGFCKNLIGANDQMKLYQTDPQFVNPWDLGFAILLYLAMFMTIPIFSYVLFTNEENLHEEQKFGHNYSNLYKDLRIRPKRTKFGCNMDFEKSSGLWY